MPVVFVVVVVYVVFVVSVAFAVSVVVAVVVLVGGGGVGVAVIVAVLGGGGVVPVVVCVVFVIFLASKRASKQDSNTTAQQPANQITRPGRMREAIRRPTGVSVLDASSFSDTLASCLRP